MVPASPSLITVNLSVENDKIQSLMAGGHRAWNGFENSQYQLLKSLAIDDLSPKFKTDRQ
jgi:hypothetical protein